MPAGFRADAHITLDADPGQVWQAPGVAGSHGPAPAAAMDMGNARAWGLRNGAEVAGRTGIGPAGFTGPMVISEWDPPRRLARLLAPP